MHEYSIAQALMDKVQGECRARGALKVHRLEVSIGALAGVEAELLASAWTLCREGTPCQEADLVIETVPARWECPRCGREFPADSPLQCSRCKQGAKLVRGDEILLDRIEMEVP